MKCIGCWEWDQIYDQCCSTSQLVSEGGEYDSRADKECTIPHVFEQVEPDELKRREMEEVRKRKALDKLSEVMRNDV